MLKNLWNRRYIQCIYKTYSGRNVHWRNKTSSEWAKRPGGETSSGRNVQWAKRPVGETSSNAVFPLWMHAACMHAARGRMHDRIPAAYDGNAACLQPALPSKCEHLHWITVYNSARQRPACRLHAGRRRPACSLHAGRFVHPELTCQFSAYNTIVLFLFLAAWRNSNTPTAVLTQLITADFMCFATSQQCLNLIVSVRQCKSINIWSHQAKNHIFLSTRDVLWPYSMPKMHDRPGLRPRPHWGSSRRSQHSLVGWGGDTSSPHPMPCLDPHTC